MRHMNSDLVGSSSFERQLQLREMPISLHQIKMCHRRLTVINNGHFLACRRMASNGCVHFTATRQGAMSDSDIMPRHLSCLQCFDQAVVRKLAASNYHYT